MGRHILHIDMNCFYASVEMQRHPEYRNVPLAVCGSQEDRHGIVLTANYLAKPRGVKVGQAIWQAKQVCPELVTLPPDMSEYIRFSHMAREIYEDYTDQIEPFGLDENWLDVTGSVGCKGSPMAIAREISERIKFELGITASIGVADNKITAKLGSDYKKPDAITRIEADNYREIVYPLPIDDLLYVCPATTRLGSSRSWTRTALSISLGRWALSSKPLRWGRIVLRSRKPITFRRSSPLATAQRHRAI